MPVMIPGVLHSCMQFGETISIQSGLKCFLLHLFLLGMPLQKVFFFQRDFFPARKKKNNTTTDKRELWYERQKELWSTQNHSS